MQDLKKNFDYVTLDPLVRKAKEKKKKEGMKL